jgi:hypothetical protein
MTYRILTTILLVVVIGGVGITWQYIFGAEKSMTDYVGTSPWLVEVDKCVDLYHETEQNEELYYDCMNKLEEVEG